MNKISTILTLRLFSCAVLINFALSLFAQNDIPDGYYDKANGLASGELKTALYEIIKNGTRVSYGNSTWIAFEKTDLHPDGTVWDMYSYEKREFPGNGEAPSGMNIEHSIAKSWWGGTKNDAYKDLYHLNPSDSKANSARSNYPLGIVTNGSMTGSLKIGKNSYGNEYTGSCFEPLDEYKGDFARAYMYMFTCYENLTWTSTNAPSMLNNNKYPMLKPWAAKLLLEWNELDPVSEKELKRASEIYKIQGNRNPFIDYPELAEYLWGGKVGETFEFTDSNDPKIVSPSDKSTFTMPEVHYTSSANIKLKIIAKNMNSPLNLSLKGEKSNMFSLSETSIAPKDGNIENDVIIHYQPQKAEDITVQLIIESANNEVIIRTINIKAVSTENFYALDAEDISGNSFTARWTPLSSTKEFEIDVYSKIITGEAEKVIASASFNGALEKDWSLSSSSDYVNFNDEPGAIRMASGNNGATLVSPLYDLSKGGKIKVTTRSWPSDKDVTLDLYIDQTYIGKIEVESTYKEYEIEFDNYDEESEISLVAVKGKRLFISGIEVMSSGETISKFSEPGYPKSITNATSHQVNGLNKLSVYYYTVTPKNSEWGVSNEIMVNTTSSTTGIEANKTNKYEILCSKGIINILGLKPGAEISIFNSSSQKIGSIQATDTSERIEISENGLYILKIEDNGVNEVFKVSVYK